MKSGHFSLASRDRRHKEDHKIYRPFTITHLLPIGFRIPGTNQCLWTILPGWTRSKDDSGHRGHTRRSVFIPAHFHCHTALQCHLFYWHFYPAIFLFWWRVISTFYLILTSLFLSAWERITRFHNNNINNNIPAHLWSAMSWRWCVSSLGRFTLLDYCKCRYLLHLIHEAPQAAGSTICTLSV